MTIITVLRFLQVLPNGARSSGMETLLRYAAGVDLKAAGSQWPTASITNAPSYPPRGTSGRRAKFYSSVLYAC